MDMSREEKWDAQVPPDVSRSQTLTNQKKKGKSLCLAYDWLIIGAVLIYGVELKDFFVIHTRTNTHNTHTTHTHTHTHTQQKKERERASAREQKIWSR